MEDGSCTYMVGERVAAMGEMPADLPDGAVYRSMPAASYVETETTPCELGEEEQRKTTRWFEEHPEYQVGSEPDLPEARWDDPTRFSYAIPEVRRNRLAVIEELVSAYDTDGIELNLGC